MSNLEKDIVTSIKEPDVQHCHSNNDGDCYWKDCPQLKNRKIYCPYADEWETYWRSQGYER
jgi:hypothetical protein